MQPYRLSIAALGLLAAVVFAQNPAPAHAGTTPSPPVITTQLELQFGLDDGSIVRLLRRRGFTDIEIQNRKFTRTRVHACLNGEKYTIDIRPNGDIARQNRTGTCGVQFTMEEARQLLHRTGYVEVVLEPIAGGFQGTACREGTRSAVFVGGPRDIRQLGIVGDCWRPVTRKEVRAILRREGYRQIEFQDYPPPPFIAIACKQRSRVEVLVAADGRIWREQQIGTCQPPLSPDAIVARLADQGFTRITVEDSNTNGHRVQLCDGDQHKVIRLTPFGEIVRQDVVDYCPPAHLGDVYKDLGKRGFTRPAIFAEVCDRGRRYRIGLDQFGGQTSREDVGSCK